MSEEKKGELDKVTLTDLSPSSPVGFKGERMRLFLTDTGYQKSLESQSCDEINIFRHAKVSRGCIFYDHPKEKAR